LRRAVAIHGERAAKFRTFEWAIMIGQPRIWTSPDC
jgi:hypothetical protein